MSNINSKCSISYFLFFPTMKNEAYYQKLWIPIFPLSISAVDINEKMENQRVIFKMHTLMQMDEYVPVFLVTIKLSIAKYAFSLFPLPRKCTLPICGNSYIAS
mgnify:CR=1 FL=1